VIPAHQEARGIGALLTDLTPLAGEVEVVVVCNGCTDETASVARQAARWVRVLEIPVGSKPQALNLGDAVCSGYPRIYLDADVRVSADAVRRILDVLAAGEESGLLAAAPTPVYDHAGASPLVRSYHRFWERLPSNRRGLAGTNVMAVTRSGRARFETWPLLIGDDYFLDGLFGAHEKIRVPEAVVNRPVSRGFLDCVSRKARIHQGNREILEAGLRSGHRGGGGAGAVRVVRQQPASAVDLPAYLLVTVASRVLFWWRRRRGTSGIWFRDASRNAPL